MMNITETIAATLDNYIDIAVQLGQFPEWRETISNKIATNKLLAYRDNTCIVALENFLEQVVRERLVEV
jgi:protein O-GlcNAc transferase